MLRMSCENEAVPQTSSNLADLLQIRECEETYDPEKRLKEAILEKCISVTANGEEMVGYVVEVRVEPRGVVIDFAGAYCLEVAKDKIADIHFVTEADVKKYLGTLVYETKESLDADVEVDVDVVMNRIHQIFSN